MSVGRICVRSVVVAEPDESVREAARRMRSEEVGTLVVLDSDDRPEGILTDRDVVVRCVAEYEDPDAMPVSVAMTGPARTISEEAPIEDALSLMAAGGTRRLAVTDDEERLVGMLALDDVLDLLAEEVETIGRLLGRQARTPPPGEESV